MTENTQTLYLQDWLFFSEKASVGDLWLLVTVPSLGLNNHHCHSWHLNLWPIPERDEVQERKELRYLLHMSLSQTAAAMKPINRMNSFFLFVSQNVLYWSWASVAHTWNPSCLGGRNQKDHESNEASQGKQFLRPCFKNTHHKKGLVEWLKL
jgi:hypothetical protein